MRTSAAVITGTANPLGIGRSIAHTFVREGYRVLGIDIAPFQDLKDESSSFQENYRHLQADISEEGDIRKIWPACQELFSDVSAVDALINNAAIVDPAMPDKDYEARIRQWKKVISVNLTGPYMVTEALLPHMRPGSSIIFVSSTRALQSEPNTEAYSSSKSGLLGLTHALALSLGSGTHGQAIRVNAVLPGWIDTSGGNDLRPEDHAWHPVGRVGRPEDVANLCLFLSSEKAAFISGQSFVVDGGVTKKMVYPE